MNVEYFISKRLFTAKEGNNRYTKPILNIAILAIALSLSMMLISIMIVSGFKQEISDKVIGFTSHITIVNYTDNQSYESEPVNINQDFYPSIINKEGVRHIQVFATKAGIVKTEEEILGTVLKGVGSDFNSLFFHQNLIEGEVPIYNDTATSNYVMISKKVSDLLSLKIEDKLIMYFVDDPPRVRKFIIHGIYETGFNDFDELVVLGDIKHIQKLNQWDSNQVGGFEIMLDDFDNIDEITDQIYEEIDYTLNAYSVKERMPHIFDWLNLQDINVKVILILMLIVAIVNMITALLILILERTRMIGILKAIGASNWSVRKVFLYNAMHLIVKGVFLGNILGLGFGFLQNNFSFISLDPDIYYMNKVPINFDFLNIIMLNLSTIIICYLVLIIPSILIARINPINAIRFE